MKFVSHEKQSLAPLFVLQVAEVSLQRSLGCLGLRSRRLRGRLGDPAPKGKEGAGEKESRPNAPPPPRFFLLKESLFLPLSSEVVASAASPAISGRSGSRSSSLPDPRPLSAPVVSGASQTALRASASSQAWKGRSSLPQAMQSEADEFHEDHPSPSCTFTGPGSFSRAAQDNVAQSFASIDSLMDRWGPCPDRAPCAP